MVELGSVVFRGGEEGIPLEAQDEVWSEAGRVDWSEFRIANVVPHGQPLIPYSEGWFTNPDGTKTASCRTWEVPGRGPHVRRLAAEPGGAPQR